MLGCGAVTEVAAWLRSLGLGEYAEAFARNHIDTRSCPTLTAGDLRKLGVLSVGHRKRLLAAIAELRRDAAVNSQEARRRPGGIE